MNNSGTLPAQTSLTASLRGIHKLRLALIFLALTVSALGYLIHPTAISGVLFAASFALLAWSLAREWRDVKSIRRAYDMAMLAAHDGFWEWNPLSKSLRVGPRLLEILGYREDFLPDTHAWLRLVHPDDVASYNRAVSRHLKGENEHFYCEYRVLASDGRYRWIASRGLAVRDRRGRAFQMVGSVTDITERRRHQEELEFLAQHDALTSLPNRLQLADDLARHIHGDSRAAILFIDLDRFKNINDSLGHRAGDRLLQLVATRLREALPPGARLYRQGGDEFIVLIENCDAETALDTATVIKETIATPFTGGESEFFTSASIGISLFPDDASDGETLLRHADTAMYEAKSTGGNAIRLHTPQMDARVVARLALETRLRHAIQQGQLQLHYQPQFATNGGRLIGAEALLRWHDGEQFIPPDRFIPVAEESGLILPIGDWVIDQAAKQVASWRKQHADLPPIAINLSPRQFWKPALARRIIDRLRALGLPGSALEVEVTESVLIDNEGDCVDELLQLREAGVCIALDDFGTGYSSLSYLHRLPISTLKIDRSFIRDLPLDGSGGGSEPLVRAIVAMAHSLSLKIVAEGVETSAQRVFLGALGCDTIQGYLTGKPVNAEEFAAIFLVDRRK